MAKQTAQRRIVGGDDAGFGSFPWQAYIRIGSSRHVHIILQNKCIIYINTLNELISAREISTLKFRALNKSLYLYYNFCIVI